MTPRQFSELGRADRRRALIRTGMIVVVAWTMIVGAYYLLPDRRGSDTQTALRLVVGLAFVAVFLGWQTGRIVRSELPQLRAIQTLGAFIPLCLVVFSNIYLAESMTNFSTFSERLDHTKALYFAITVFSTVGFGDIIHRTDPARIVVSIQMLLDLVVLVVVVRLLVSAAKTGLAREH
jgi:voltage-gated potassium channel